MSMPAETAAMTPWVSFILAVTVGHRSVLEFWKMKGIQTSFIRTGEQEESSGDSDWYRCRKRNHQQRSKGSRVGGKRRYPCTERKTFE